MVCHMRSTASLRKPFFCLALSAATALCAFAQPPGFSFSTGNLILTRSIYSGDATVVTVGQSLPPVCPSTAKCGTAKATDTGAYPIAGSTNNVWNNENPDANFGVTSPIFLDQITPGGTLINTLAIPTNMVTTSFSSKSELAINLSADGTALTFMAYMAPPNTIDVSNGNTPTVYDPTNPAGGSFYRAVVQVAANGAIMVTPTSAYNGNNGRAAILADGRYYLVGNSNNGSGTPANVVVSGGVQLAMPGQSPATLPIQIGNFSITQVNDPATGKPYAADKVGKDNNFRGLTLFNSTLYITKGSGSNGINTVYQVGPDGTLPTLFTAPTTPINILPGFPTVLARTADVTYMFPFGLWFADANTLYVSDEGDGAAADAAITKNAGLQKWSRVNGVWKLDYVLQNGLNLGQPYTIANYPASLNPATGGLRNVTGRVNGDGTVTIWALTATVSANTDAGADPNKLVSITDVLANTTAAGAASEQFVTLRTAVAGEVLRGIAFAPAWSPNPIPMANAPVILSAANTGVVGLAPGSIASANFQGLAIGNPGKITGTLPTTFGGTSVTIVDSAGRTFAAPLMAVTASQVNFVVPSGVGAGPAQISVTNAGITETSNVPISPVAPALFTAGNAGLVAATAIRAPAGGGAAVTTVTYSTAANGAVVPTPVNLGAAGDQVVLSLFGTGIQAAGVAGVTVTVGGVNAQVQFVGPQGATPGLDQVNVLLPASLVGKGNVPVQLTAAGVAAPTASVTIQ
jgi:uncharacterized protein (TIGR03437 family)